MPSTTQCQNPEPVGASGSKQVTAKLLVSAGKPDQESDGEMFAPPVEDLVFRHLLSVRDVVAVQLEGRHGRHEIVRQRCAISHDEPPRWGGFPRYRVASAATGRPAA
jgi:hypothetical protein